jgi:murein endopeptidase
MRLRILFGVAACLGAGLFALPDDAEARTRSGRGFIQLKGSGTGFGAYSLPSKRWGVPRLVYGVERAAARWQHPQRPRMMIGNISLRNGGRLPPHVSHRDGVDVDILPLRRDKLATNVVVGQRAYSRTRTRTVMTLIRQEVRVRLILFNDRGIGGTIPWPGHSNHFHTRVR